MKKRDFSTDASIPDFDEVLKAASDFEEKEFETEARKKTLQETMVEVRSQSNHPVKKASDGKFDTIKSEMEELADAVATEEAKRKYQMLTKGKKLPKGAIETNEAEEESTPNEDKIEA